MQQLWASGWGNDDLERLLEVTQRLEMPLTLIPCWLLSLRRPPSLMWRESKKQIVVAVTISRSQLLIAGSH